MSKFTTRVSLNDQNYIQKSGDTLTFNGRNIFSKPLSAATFTFVGATPQILTKTRIIISGVTNPSFRGLEYGSNHSSNFLKRSIPDVEFLTGTTTSLFNVLGGSNVITGATNGLTKIGKRVKLGGSLTENTTIELNSRYFSVVDTTDGIGVVVDGETAQGNVSIQHSLIGMLEFKNTGAIFTDLRATKRGIQYNGDYSSNFNLRSLVDVGYVTNVISQLSNDLTNITIANITFTATTLTNFIGVSGSTSLIYLPTSPTLGQKIYIKDIVGDANSNPITINGNGNNIDGSSTALINSNYGSISLIWYGKEWSVIGFI